MENENFIQKLGTSVGQNATIQKIFGEPILAGDKTIIPVATIAYGFGGGGGQGRKNKTNRASTNTEENPTDSFGEGLGGGGGMVARPLGVYEVSPSGTRFIPVNNPKKLFVQLAVCFLLVKWINRKMAHPKQGNDKNK